MSSSGDIQYNYYYFHVYGRLGTVTGKSHSFRTLRGAKAKATSYMYNYVGNHTNQEIADNCVSISIFNTKNLQKPICTKYVEAMESWSYHDN